MKITKNTSYAIDLIKGICSICVLFMHVSWLTNDHETWFLHPFLSKLTVLMVMFFIINGFLFSIKNNQNINYIKRIILRIYPVFLFIFLSNFILMFLSDLYFPDFYAFHTRFLHLYEINEINLIVNLLFIQGFFSDIFDKSVDGSWFLCNIIYINFIFIFIPNLFKIKRLIYIFIFCIVFEVLVLKLISDYYHIDNYFRVHFFLKFIPPFVLGILANLIFNEEYYKNYLLKNSKLIFCVSFILFCASFSNTFRFLYNSEINMFFQFLLFLSFLALYANRTRYSRGELFLIKIGKNSLNFFLLHVFIMWPIAFFFKKFIDNNPEIVFFQFIGTNFLVLFFCLFAITTFLTLNVFNKLNNLIVK